MNRRSFLSKLLTLPIVGAIAAKMITAPTEPLTATGAMVAEANKYPYGYGLGIEDTIRAQIRMGGHRRVGDMFERPQYCYGFIKHPDGTPETLTPKNDQA